MDGRNSSGCRVSLLNDLSNSFASNSTKVPAKLPLLTASNKSQSPSEASTPGFSPQTPPLIRSESSDSAAFASPSPITPQSASFEQSQSQAKHQAQSYYPYRQSWSKMDDPTLYPAIPEGVALNSYPLAGINAAGQIQPRIRSSDSPMSESHLSNASAASANATSSKSATKKSQYPCPLAKQYKCNDFFTTSGHAARHAKKHTGRKDAICPECNKAFTRKDNMEQHRRTHQNVRGPAKPAKSENRVIKKSKGSRKSTSNAPLEAAVAQQLEEDQLQAPAMPIQYSLPGTQTLPPALIPGSGPYFMNADPVAALPHPVSADFINRPPLYRSNYTNSLDFAGTGIMPNLGDPNDLHFTYPSPGLSNGLNTLAMAASDHRRRLSEEEQSAKSEATTPGVTPP